MAGIRKNGFIAVARIMETRVYLSIRRRAPLLSIALELPWRNAVDDEIGRRRHRGLGRAKYALPGLFRVPGRKGGAW
jgi:hypothetical protein